MHESPIVRGLIASAVDAARGHGRLHEVSVVVGEWSGIDLDSLRAHFAEMTAGTAAEGARLTIRTEPGRALCWDCSRTSVIGRAAAACPACGSSRIRVGGGVQCYVESVDVAEEGSMPCV